MFPGADFTNVDEITVDKNDLPPEVLSLRVGCRVILIRNISRSLGLSNGIKLTVDTIDPLFLRCHKLVLFNLSRSPSLI